MYWNSIDFSVCLSSSYSFAIMQNVLLMLVKHTDIVIHVLTNETKYHTGFTFRVSIFNFHMIWLVFPTYKSDITEFLE